MQQNNPETLDRAPLAKRHELIFGALAAVALSVPIAIVLRVRSRPRPQELGGWQELNPDHQVPNQTDTALSPPTVDNAEVA